MKYAMVLCGFAARCAEGALPFRKGCAFIFGLCPCVYDKPLASGTRGIVRFVRLTAYLFIVLLFTTVTANAQTKGAITGRVVADDGSGMAGVTVMLTPAASQTGPLGNYRRSTTTDEEGNFRFADIPARPYNLLVVSSREYAQPPTVTASGERRYYRIGEHIQISLIRGGVITGRVINSLGEPVIAISVVAIRVRDHEGRAVKEAPSSVRRQTDDRGVYRFYGLQPGSYILVANSNSNTYGGSAYYGETPTYYPSSTRDAAAEVTVASGSEAAGIDIRYRGEPGHAVSGKITGGDQTGPSGPGVVYLTHAATGTSFDSFYVNRDGFAFYGVPDGEYDLTAERYEDGRTDGFASQPRRVTVRGADVTGIEVRLSPKSSIAGRVVLERLPQRCDEKSEPAMEEIVLRAHRDEATKTPSLQNLYSPRDATAGDKGEFTLKALVPARYRLRAILPGETWRLKSITAPAPAPASGADLARNGVLLKPGERMSGITVTIAEDAARLRGRVTPEKEGARLPAKLAVHLVPMETLSADDVLRYGETVAERDGAFELKNMAPGKYRLLARAAPDDEPTDRPLAPAAWDANERAKLRREAETLKIEVELKPCQSVADQTIRWKAR